MPPGQKEPRRAKAQELVDLIDAFHAMCNTHRVDGVLSFFTEDAVITVVGLPNDSSIRYRGTWVIQEMLQTYLPGWHVHARSHYPTDTNRAMWMERISADWIRRLGLDWVEAKVEVILRDRKIAAFTVTYMPESVAKIDAAMRRCAEES